MDELIAMLPLPSLPKFKIPSIPIPSMPSLPSFDFSSLVKPKPEKIPRIIKFKYKLLFYNYEQDDLLDEENYHENDILKYYSSWGYIKKYLLLELAFKMMKYNPSSRIVLLGAMKEIKKIEKGDPIKLMVHEFHKRKVLFPYQELILETKLVVH